MTMRFTLILMAMSMIWGMPMTHASESDAEQLARLRQELEQIQAHQLEIREKLAEQSKALWENQRDLESADIESATIREQLIESEDDLKKKRQDLKALIQSDPAISALEQQRRDLQHTMSTLRQHEADGTAASSEQLRDEIQRITEQLRALEKKRWRVEHDLEYEDPAAAELRRDIKRTEKLVLDMRRHLKIRAGLDPEISAEEKERGASFRDLKKLKAEETAIRKEIAAIRARAILEE